MYIYVFCFSVYLCVFFCFINSCFMLLNQFVLYVNYNYFYALYYVYARDVVVVCVCVCVFGCEE